MMLVFMLSIVSVVVVEYEYRNSYTLGNRASQRVGSGLGSPAEPSQRQGLRQ